MNTVQNNTQNIILYRNPLEQQFWESGMVWPLLVALLTVVVVLLAATKAFERIFGYWKVQQSKVLVALPIILGVVCGAVVFSFMLL